MNTATAHPCLAVDQVSAGYGGGTVINEVTLEASRGEVVAILGANGVGKTTTMRVISGLIKPNRGTVLLEGSPIDSDPVRTVQSGIALVPEDRCLFRSLTAAKNLSLAARPGRWDTSAVVDLFPPLKALLRRRAGLLSGGEQQMLAIARALVMNPKVLLIDELSTGLAPLVARQLLSTLRCLADEEGMTVLMVEQHVPLALETADRVYVLRKGQIVRQGAASDLRDSLTDLSSSYLGGHESGHRGSDRDTA